MSRTGKSIAQIGGTILGGTIGTIIAPGVGTALGASIGSGVGNAVSNVIPDDNPILKNSLALGPGNINASYSESPVGKDYTITEYQKDPGTSPLAKGLDIANMAIKTGAELYGQLSIPKSAPKFDLNKTFGINTKGIIDPTLKNMLDAPLYKLPNYQQYNPDFNTLIG